MVAIGDVAGMRVVREVLDHPSELGVGRLIDRRAALTGLTLVRVEPDEVPVARVEAVVQRPGRGSASVGENGPIADLSCELIRLQLGRYRRLSHCRFRVSQPQLRLALRPAPIAQDKPKTPGPALAANSMRARSRQLT